MKRHHVFVLLLCGLVGLTFAAGYATGVDPVPDPIGVGVQPQSAMAVHDSATLPQAPGGEPL